MNPCHKSCRAWASEPRRGCVQGLPAFLGPTLFGPSAARCVARPRRRRAATARDLAFGRETWRGHTGDFGEKGRTDCRAVSHFGDGDRVGLLAAARADDPAVIAFRLGVAPASPDIGGRPAPSSIAPVLAPVLARVARPDHIDTAVRVWVDEAPGEGVRGMATDRIVSAAVGPLTPPKAARFFHASREGKLPKLGIGGETRHCVLRGTSVAPNERVGRAPKARWASRPRPR